MSVDHPNHSCRLYSKNLNCLFECSGCKEQGHNHVYECLECSYKLHRQCAIAPSFITHKFLGRHILKLRHKPPPGKSAVCEACFRDVRGFVYHCEAKGWNLHPCCAKLDPVVKTGVEGVELNLKSNMKSKCGWCGIKKPHGLPSGWSYVSKCGVFHFHVGCIKEAMEESWSQAHLKLDEGSSSDLALQVRGRSKGIVLHDDDGRPILDLVKYDGSSKIVQRIKKYWQVAKALFSGVLCILLGTTPSMQVIQLMATVFGPGH